ncbi:MAG: hypothetical protein WAN56_00810 [Halobacteriota archaeon]
MRYKDELHRNEWQAERMAFDAEAIKMLSEYAPAQELHDDRPVFGNTRIIDELLSENKTNAILHSEIAQLRVKLPSVLHRGIVTLTTAQGENVFRILQKATPIKALSSSKQGIPRLNPYPADWEFLKSPPPKLAGKLWLKARCVT